MNPLIKVLAESGHLWHVDPSRWDKLKPTDPEVVQAGRSLSVMMPEQLTAATMRDHGTIPSFDGELGPSVTDIIQQRSAGCRVPDHAPPAGVAFHFECPHLQEVCERMQQDAAAPSLGTGNWRSCHGYMDDHAVSVSVNETGMPSFLGDVFQQVKERVTASYAEVGLRVLWNAPAPVNVDFSFVSRSDGWIGLAIVGQNQSCGDKIWCRYLSTYRPSNIVSEWTTLIKHELGHNCGLSHSSGGVMNPAIVRGLPVSWKGDPSYSRLMSKFGGPIDDEDPPPNEPEPEVTREEFRHLQATVMGMMGFQRGDHQRIGEIDERVTALEQ